MDDFLRSLLALLHTPKMRDTVSYVTKRLIGNFTRDTLTRFTMAISKKQFPYLLLLVASACFLLISDFLSSDTDVVPHRQMQSNVEYGEILPDGTLFIPVGNLKGRSRGQNLDERVGDTRGKMCKDLLADRSERKLTRLHVQAELCGDFSLGNIISTIMSYNLAAHLANIPFTFSCVDSKPGVMALMEKSEDVPFLPSDYSKENYNLEEFCENNFFHDMAHGHYLIADIMRNQIASSQSVITDGDDAVIHVRLHDAFKSIGELPSERGLFPHIAYTSMLKKAEEEKGEIQTISIVTQSFWKDNVRDNEQEFTELSKTVGRDLARQLQIEFPNAKVSIHNDRETETTVTSYSRLVRAKKIAICGCSTFCPFPVMSVEDDVMAYLYNSKYLNQFFTNYLAGHKDNIHLWDAPMLGSNDIGGLTDLQIIEFLRNENTTDIHV